MTVLTSHALAVGYRRRRRADRVLLSGLELALPAGELTCLLGPNGSGKSTLLRTLAGMQEPLSGEVRLLGDDVGALEPRERARRLSVVLTEPVDTGLMRAADLVALGRYPHTGWGGRLSDDDVAAVRWALRVTGAAPLAARRVLELSDGERQRVLIARALAQQPAVLALDEPVAFVDLPRRVELTQLLRDLARECGLAVLLTTHDLDLALRSADTLWLIDPHAEPDQRLRTGAPEDLLLAGAVAAAFR
ncbi:MAG: ABC transporter ATP-binding protein, partial [Egibacteraceae bacterium]